MSFGHVKLWDRGLCFLSCFFTEVSSHGTIKLGMAVALSWLQCVTFMNEKNKYQVALSLEITDSYVRLCCILQQWSLRSLRGETIETSVVAYMLGQRAALRSVLRSQVKNYGRGLLVSELLRRSVHYLWCCENELTSSVCPRHIEIWFGRPLTSFHQ